METCWNGDDSNEILKRTFNLRWIIDSRRYNIDAVDKISQNPLSFSSFRPSWVQVLLNLAAFVNCHEIKWPNLLW